ncbi:MAG: carbamoyltransferase HypF [Sphingobacteriia bacterium]|nr:carbamoyltransferase HypF [Sphingobacteriia bacterium]
MLRTYNIHIRGLVQGVGFRPFVCKLAKKMNISGWVSNTNEGVMIEFTANLMDMAAFYHAVTNTPPRNALIAYHDIFSTETKSFEGFTIRQSFSTTRPDLLLTPDIAICSECKTELTADTNRRNGYAFTTCLNCGPRYSIVDALPYDREHTTMKHLVMCEDCHAEYHDIQNRRHYSQTNSCKSCAVKMHLYQSPTDKINIDQSAIVCKVAEALLNGKIIAVKGIGGYLLMCDATNPEAIQTLRIKKHRPSKPLAVLYPDIHSASKDVELRLIEEDTLLSNGAPIVLCKLRPTSGNSICTSQVAPGLTRLGVMIAYSPLLYLLSLQVGRPLIATSANISGSPIIYKDQEALAELFEAADWVLTYDREILVPQDDSVMQFTDVGQRIILRRGRGLAPNYFPNPFRQNEQTLLAAGGELKSAFAILDRTNLYVSQYLGDQGTVESQESYSKTLHHLLQLLQTAPAKVLVDSHPGYFVSQYGKELTNQNGYLPVVEIQHHKAHFAAVLAENKLLHAEEPVMGIIWDGTGYGDDKQIWGSECFVYQQREMKRVAHLNYFPQLAGDKMSKEPRLSALSLLSRSRGKMEMLRPYFSATEWAYFQKLLKQEQPVQTSSMGRFLDGLACMLGIKSQHSYEGEAAMLMEASASNAVLRSGETYPLEEKNGVLNWDRFLEQFLTDIAAEIPVAEIAWKVFHSLAVAIVKLCAVHKIKKVAFSGGVFQNALLTDLVAQALSGKINVYFHQQLSPNDECIGFGQLACFEITQQRTAFLLISGAESIHQES